MSRAKILKQNKKFEDYNYMIMGVPGIGKTLLAADIGKVVTGKVQGTVVVTLGDEPIPEHLGGHIFNDYCSNFKELIKATKEYCDERETTYKETKFIALDSLDELFRIAEQYVIEEWNGKCKPEERAKSISQAYKGFQKGEDRVINVILGIIGKLKGAGYKLIYIAHTKKKTINDEYSEISFEQIVCSVNSKYYSCIKDKVNLLATCYFKNVFENVKTVKNAFTKSDMEKGKLIGRKRVIVLDSKKLSIDIKSHWSTLPEEIPLNAQLFVKTVEKGIAAEYEAIERRINMSANEITDMIEAIEPDEIEANSINNNSDIEETADDILEKVPEAEETADEIDDIFEEDIELEPDIDLRKVIYDKFKDLKDEKLKKEIRTTITKYGKFDDVPDDVIKQIYNKLN